MPKLRSEMPSGTCTGMNRPSRALGSSSSLARNVLVSFGSIWVLFTGRGVGQSPWEGLGEDGAEVGVQDVAASVEGDEVEEEGAFISLGLVIDLA